MFYQSVFKKVASAGLNSLWQKFLSPKWPMMVPFCGVDHQKSNFSLISDTFSVGGCWGQPMLLFWKLDNETQMSNPFDHAARDIPSKFSIFLPLRAIYFRSYQYETPCRINQSCTQTNKKSIRLGIITTRSIKNGVS